MASADTVRLLEVEDLSASWVGEPVLGYDAERPVSFALEAGEWLLVAGVNGVGKSTLLHALAGETPYVRGGVRVGGRPLRPGRPRERKQAGMQLVPQVSRWQDPLPLADAVDLVARGRPMLRGEEVRACEQRFAEAGLLMPGGLLPPRVFDLACVVLERPAVLILDEVGPIWKRYGGDPRRDRRALYDVLRELLPGAAVVFTEHATQTALGVATRVLWLRDGAPPSSFQPTEADVAHRLQAELADDPPPPVESEEEARASWRLVLRTDQPVQEQVRLALNARRAAASDAATPAEVEQDFPFLRASKPAAALSGGEQTVLRWFLLEYTGLGRLPDGLTRHLDRRNRGLIAEWRGRIATRLTGPAGTDGGGGA